MINQGFYSATPTKLSLNGPYMSFTSLPEGIRGNPGDTVNLVGVATAGFIGTGATTVNDGNVVYRWYEVGVGALSDGNRLSGTNTNTLTITNLQSPGDSSRQFYLEAKYQSTAYENRSGGKNGNQIAPAISNPALAEVRPFPTASITASSTSIPYNGSVTISWSTTDADTLSSNFGDTRLNATETFSNQTSSRTFSINAINSTGSTPASVSVNVAAAPPPPPPPPSAPFLNFAASTSTTIPYNGSVSFSLTTFDADNLSSNFGYSKSGLGGAVFNDSFTISDITQTQDYILTATGPGGSTPKTIPINVSAPPPSIVITSQPSSVSATFDKCTGGGGSVTFSVGASVNNQPGEALQYQWYLNGSALSNGTNVSGAQSSTLTLKVLENQSGNNTVYARISYSGASTVQSNSASYSVTVTEPRPSLSITSQPTNQTVFVGETATFSVGASISNYNRTPAYQWYKNGSAISGATSSSLSIAPSSAGSDNYYVIVSDSSTTCTSVPSSIQSNTVTLTASVPQKIIRVASRGDTSTSVGYQDVNLSSFSFGSSGNWEVYSPFEDIQVDMKIEAGAGSNKGSFSGGRGGQAIVRFTLRRNTEYIIRSLSGSSNGGGGATFIYEKARLIACVGGGGGAGTGGNGGAGGGVGSSGGSGSGAGAGGGGTKGAASLGYFPGGDNYCDSAASSSIFGGLVSSCTIGDFACAGPGFWQTGYSPCGDYGFRTALNISGQNVSGTASISRGFKGGVAHRNNGGFAQTSNDGAGGSGCEGGRAALPGSNAGGGGGNGYNGGVSVVSNRTGGRSGGTQGQFTIALPGRLSL